MLERLLRFVKLYLAAKPRLVFLFLILRNYLSSSVFIPQIPTDWLDRRRILFVDGSTPRCDSDAGSLSIVQFMELFANHGWQVHLWPFDQKDLPQARQDLQQKGIDIILPPSTRNSFKSWMRRHSERYDVVFVSRPALAAVLLPWLRDQKAKLAYYGHDLHGVRFKQEALITGHLELGLLSHEYSRLERRICSAFDCSYYPSGQEVMLMNSALPDATIKELPPYAIDVDDLTDPAPPTGAHLLFVGNFKHLPNVDAANWLLEEIWPCLRQRLRGAHLTIAGGKPPASLIERAQSSSGDVTLTGWISDQELQETYRSSRIVIVPLRFGAGVKHKVIAAVVQGCPVVTTEIGLQGLPELRDVVGLAGNAQEFTKECEQLVSNNELWISRVCFARRALSTRFSRESMWRALKDLHDDT